MARLVVLVRIATASFEAIIESSNPGARCHSLLKFTGHAGECPFRMGWCKVAKTGRGPVSTAPCDRWFTWARCDHLPGAG